MTAFAAARARREVAAAGADASSPRTALTLKAALLLGFGVTVGIWVFAGIYFGGRVTDLNRRSAVVSERFVQAQRLLTEARLAVLQSSVELRDALLADEIGVADITKTSMAALDEAAARLAEYAPVGDDSGGERGRIERLLVEIAALRQARIDVLASGRREWTSTARAALQERFVPRRQQFLDVANELGDLNRTAFVAHQRELVALYQNTQRSFWRVLTIALLASLAVAVGSTFYAARLERRVRRQHDDALDLQRGLQRLSSELIRVREDERRVIARELHDEIGQLLTAAKFELVVAQNTVSEHGGPANVLDDARPIVERALHAVRDLSHMLHPAVLDDLGLSAAVDLHIKEFRRRHAIAVELVETDMADRLPRDIETAAYRIVQEALTNVAKHAHASSCRVSLVRLSAGLMVVVGDDGVGFDVGAARDGTTHAGLGLVSMHERAAQLGGGVVIESARGLGTRVVAELPLGDVRSKALPA